MMIIIISLIVIFFLVIGLPIAFVLILTALIISLSDMSVLPLIVIPQNMATSIDSFTLLAIPIFILAAKIMNEAEISRRIFEFSQALIGHIHGGLAHVNIMASLIFSGMSGSAVADSTGLGEIEIEAMKKNGYDGKFSAAITGASAIIGPIFPPSIPMLVYGALVQVSVAKMFIAGIIPGILMAIFLFFTAYIISVKRNYPKTQFPGVKYYIKNLLISLYKTLAPLFTPIIILASIFFGIATPTEAAVAAVLYSILLGCIYKTITLKKLIKLTFEAGIASSIILFIITGVTSFSWTLTSKGIPQALTKMIFQNVNNPNLVIFLIMIVLFVIGLFMNPTPGILLFVPLILPTLKYIEMNLVQAGVLIVLTLSIGLLTPPVGLVLFIVSKISETDIREVIIELIPFIITLLFVTFLVAYFPAITQTLLTLL